MTPRNYLYDFYIHPIGLFLLLISVVVIGVSSWVAANRMRRRIKDDLGKNTPAADDLTSIQTWMKVDKVEEKKHPGHDWAPKDSDPGPDLGGMIDLLPEDKRR